MDIKNREGTSIYSQWFGIVYFCGWKNGYGNTILVYYGRDENRNVISALFAHLKSFNAKKGDFVKPWQKIGEMGKTGRVTGSHLHYEIRENDEPVNPIGFDWWKVNLPDWAW